MNSIRVRFIRGEEVKFISHLDLMKMFERALRRSNIPIAYSKGFNPHPQMVFGLPLSVGVTSEAEYAEFDLESSMEPDEFVQRLNQYLPYGINIIGAVQKSTGSNIMASITGALYQIVVTTDKNVGIKDLKDKIKKFLEEKEILIDKESKGKIRQVDICPMIYSVTVSRIITADSSQMAEDLHKENCEDPWILRYVEKLEKEDEFFKRNKPAVFCFTMLLAAGSAANLKPEFVISAFNSRTGFGFDILKIHRSGLFIGGKDELMDPLNNQVLLSI